LNFGIVDMLLRENTWQVYEYYALVQSVSGMVVLKLDALGQPFQPHWHRTMNIFITCRGQHRVCPPLSLC